jgi:hypothetical protein
MTVRATNLIFLLFMQQSPRCLQHIYFCVCWRVREVNFYHLEEKNALPLLILHLRLHAYEPIIKCSKIWRKN